MTISGKRAIFLWGWLSLVPRLYSQCDGPVSETQSKEKVKTTLKNYPLSEYISSKLPWKPDLTCGMSGTTFGCFCLRIRQATSGKITLSHYTVIPTGFQPVSFCPFICFQNITSFKTVIIHFVISKYK